MAGLILDAGPLIGWERRDRRVSAWLREAQQRDVPVIICAASIAEVWRGGQRSARTAQLMRSCEVIAVDERLARDAGELLSAASSEHTIDALVVAAAGRHHARVLTTDPSDIEPLAARVNVPFAVL